MWSMPVFITLLLLSEIFTNAASIDNKSSGASPRTAVVSVPLLSHRHVFERARRERRQLVDETEAEDDELQAVRFYQGYGTHYVDLWCGTPHPQRQTVILDTGSGMTAFPCSGCCDCGVPDYHADSLYQTKASETFQKVDCEECIFGNCYPFSKECSVSARYAEGSSWRAYEAIDQCYIGGLHGQPILPTPGSSMLNPDPFDPNHALHFPLQFGCQTRVTGLFKTQLADGIMGMDNVKSSFWRQMVQAGKLSRAAFSLCFRRSQDISRNGTTAGALTLGGSDTRLHTSPMVYSKISFFMGFYVVRVRGIYWQKGDRVESLGVSEQDMNRGRLIVDSGTTDSYFSSLIFPSFANVYEDMMGTPYNQEVKMFTADTLAQEPTILVQLEGKGLQNRDIQNARLAGDLDPAHPLDVIVAIPPENYYEYDSRSGGYIARFSNRHYESSILGANAITGHDVLVDVDGRQMGWAESDCSYDDMAAPFPTPPPVANWEALVTDDDTCHAGGVCGELCSMGVSFVGLVAVLGCMLHCQKRRRKRQQQTAGYEPTAVNDEEVELQELNQDRVPYTDGESDEEEGEFT